MKLLLLIICSHLSFASFFNDSLEVDKEYSIQTKQTRTDATYRITVSGEYSQWGNSIDPGIGNDAVWYNDVPRYGLPV